jgi:hypothetical protein
MASEVEIIVIGIGLIAGFAIEFAIATHAAGFWGVVIRW